MESRDVALDGEPVAIAEDVPFEAPTAMWICHFREWRPAYRAGGSAARRRSAGMRVMAREAVLLKAGAYVHRTVATTNI